MVRLHRETLSLLDPAPLVRGRSVLDEIDPRGRIVVAVAFSVIVGIGDPEQFVVPGLALAVAAFGAVAGRLRPVGVLRRLLPLNVVVLLVVAILPWSMPGAPLARLGPIAYSMDGLLHAVVIGVKANAIMVAIVVLLGTLDVVTLGHALAHLHVPQKLIHLLLFTVQYFDVLNREHLRLRAAMRVRGFRPRVNRHTYRAYGYLVGMLLVRSLDRSERVVAAMKCRGFRGRFYLLDHFAYRAIDVWFAAASLFVLVTLALAEWT